MEYTLHCIAWIGMYEKVHLMPDMVLFPNSSGTKEEEKRKS